MKKSTEILLKNFITLTKGYTEFKVNSSTTEKKELSKKESISIYTLLYSMSKGDDKISAISCYNSDDMLQITLSSSFFLKDGEVHIVSLEATLII